MPNRIRLTIEDFEAAMTEANTNTKNYCDVATYRERLVKALNERLAAQEKDE